MLKFRLGFLSKQVKHKYSETNRDPLNAIIIHQVLNDSALNNRERSI